MTDPISDMLTRIRNGSKARKDAVSIPLSKIKFEIARILKKENYIGEFTKRGKGAVKYLDVSLKYEQTDAATPQSRTPIIDEIRRVSRPGQRIYASFREIKPVKNGHGIVVISTPKGLLTGAEARREKVGGEVLFEIW